MTRPLPRPAAALFASLALALPGAAQLELPDKPATSGSGEKGASESTGLPARGHGPKRPDDLELPSGGEPKQPAGPTEEPGPASEVDDAPAVGWEAADGAADFIRGEISRLEDPSDPLVRKAIASLGTMGEEGLSVARAMLLEDRAAPLATGAQVLLEYGTPADRRAVALRVRERIPARASSTLVEALSSRAPDQATDAFLVELLDHVQGGVRAAAQRELVRRAPEGWSDAVSALVGTSRRSDTRLRGLELVASVPGTGRVDLLVASLDDSISKVAWRAAHLLSLIDEPTAPTRLVEVAFDAASPSRSVCYALLSVAEREDRQGEGILTDAHVPTLLARLESNEPLVSGSAAVALAGVGFRSGAPGIGVWLDRLVPHVLVKAVSGAEFHADFSSLQGPAQRRLTLISGEAIGMDGAAWRAWWVENAGRFRARRAAIGVGPSTFAAVEVYYRAGADGVAFHLSGPEVDSDDTAVRARRRDAGDAYFLTEVEARSLFTHLHEQGLFGSERLPGVRGHSGPRQRTLRVAVGEQEKLFGIGEGAELAWLDASMEAALEIAERNRWQRYRDPRRYLTDRAFFDAESPWWDANPGRHVRELRLKQLLIGHLRGVAATERAEPLEALAELFGRSDVAEGADLPHLLQLLGEEPFPTGRTARLTELAIAAAGAVGEPGAPIGAALAADIVDTLDDTFGADGSLELASVLRAAEPAAARTAAGSESDAVRAAAASALGESAQEADLDLLEGLLDDGSLLVEASAVRALGAARAERAVEDVLERATSAQVPVRAAALRAAAELGVPRAKGVLLLALTDPDVLVQRAAAEGLAILADPETAPAMAKLLRRGSRSPTFDAARAGLIALGEAAWPELLRLAQSGSFESRREAALLLSRQGAGEVATVLVMILSHTPEDDEVARELAVLSGVDLRGAEEPALAWWEWWDAAPRDDPAEWFCRSLRERGLVAPTPTDLGPTGTRFGANCLLEVLGRREAHLVERARRELGRLLGGDVGPVPTDEAELADWVEGLRARVDAAFPG